jgi:phospholipase C
MTSKSLVAYIAFIVLICAGCSSSGSSNVEPQSAPPLSRVRNGPSTVSGKISHVVVIIQENRSFENFFAGYPRADAPTWGWALSDGKRVKVNLHQITFEVGPNLSHLWKAGINDWQNGDMDGFSKYGLHHDDAAYAFVERSQVQPYWDMAKQYVLAAHMFPTEFGPSWTGHITLVAGTDNLSPDLAVADFSSGAFNSCDSPQGTQTSTVDQYRHEDIDGGPFPCFTQFRSMADSLDAAGVSWKYYVTKIKHAGIWSPFEAIKDVRRGPDWQKDLVQPETQVLTDAQTGNLAQVSWVTPNKTDSDHPASHSDRGPSWVSSIVNAIGKSQYWNSTAIVVVWDDWGGFYDNAPPPQLDFRGLGIRVPCLIISPYAKKGYVSKTDYEFGSILKFMEEAFSLPPLGSTSDGYTDTRANSLDDSFDFTQAPRAFKKIKSKYPMQDFLHEPASWADAPVDTE